MQTKAIHDRDAGGGRLAARQRELGGRRQRRRRRSGIRAALERGAGAAVDLLGRKDGFLGNPKVRIPLPGYLKDAAKLLRLTGQQQQVDELVTAMNRAAEAAVPEAKDAAGRRGQVDERRATPGGSSPAATTR